MITLFTVPKPFHGHIGVIQRNAIGSWARLEPRCQVIVCGEEEGARAAADELGVEFVPEVKRNAFGTPLLSDVFAQAEARARHGLVGYVNADILLLADFASAAAAAARWRGRFLMVGQRWDLDVREALPFTDPGWSEATRRRARHEGALHPPMGSDYFVYPRGVMGTLPEFAVGRPGWDNWFIWRARALRIPVLDATGATTVVHQNHDYAHVQRATGTDWEGPEAVRNLELMGEGRRRFTLRDATHLLGEAGVSRAWTSDHLRRRVGALDALHPSLRPLVDALRAVRAALGGRATGE